MLPLIKTDLGMSDVMMGAIGSAFLWVYAICSPASGLIGDRLPRGRVIVWTLVAWSVVTLATAWVRTPAEMIAAFAQNLSASLDGGKPAGARVSSSLRSTWWSMVTERMKRLFGRANKHGGSIDKH